MPKRPTPRHMSKNFRASMLISFRSYSRWAAVAERGERHTQAGNLVPNGCARRPGRPIARRVRRAVGAVDGRQLQVALGKRPAEGPTFEERGRQRGRGAWPVQVLRIQTSFPCAFSLTDREFS